MFLQYENLEADNYEDYEWIKNNSSELFFNISLRESTNKNNYINSDFRQDTHYKDEMMNSKDSTQQNHYFLQTIPEQESEENKSEIRESDPFTKNLAALTIERTSNAYFNNMISLRFKKPIKKASPFTYLKTVYIPRVSEQSEIFEEEGISACHVLSPQLITKESTAGVVIKNRGSECFCCDLY